MNADDPMTRCDNCGNECLESDLPKSLHQIHHLAERLDPGSEVPAGECKCGALAYVIDDPHKSEGICPSQTGVHLMTDEMTPLQAARYCALRGWELWFDREDAKQPYAVMRENWSFFDWTWNDPLSIEMLDEVMASALADGPTSSTGAMRDWVSSGRIVRVEVDI